MFCRFRVNKDDVFIKMNELKKNRSLELAMNATVFDPLDIEMAAIQKTIWRPGSLGSFRYRHGCDTEDNLETWQSWIL